MILAIRKQLTNQQNIKQNLIMPIFIVKATKYWRWLLNNDLIYNF